MTKGASLWVSDDLIAVATGTSRSEISSSGEVARPQTLSAPGIESMFAMPRLSVKDDVVEVAFRDHANRPVMSTSQDGIHFTNPQMVADVKGFMPCVVGLGKKSHAYVCQTGEMSQMTSSVRISEGNGNWCAPLPVSASSTNVHDTTILPRLDGGADLYYSHTGAEHGAKHGYQLYRRSLDEYGHFGREEKLTDDSISDAMKPHPIRLADGKVMLAYAQGLQRDPQYGYPVRERLDAIVLDHDAEPWQLANAIAGMPN